MGEVTDSLLIATKESLGRRGGSELRGSVGNVKYSFWLQNVTKFMIWEQALNSHSALQLFSLFFCQRIYVLKCTQRFLWEKNIMDLYVTFSSKTKRKQNTKLSVSKTLPKLSLWCIALGKPARLFNTFIAWSWELNLLFTDPSPVIGHDHISAYIIPSRFCSTHWFKNQSLARFIISVLLLGYMSQVLSCQWQSNAVYSSTCFCHMRKERLASCFFSQSTVITRWHGQINTFISPTVQEFPVVHLFMFWKFSHGFTIPLGRWFFKISNHQYLFELLSFYTTLSLLSSHYLYS